MTTVDSAKKYEELLGPSAAPSPYEFATLFKAESFMGRQRAKKRFKLIKALDLKLRQILNPGEKVYFVTTGTTLSMGERFLVGWLAHLVNMRALVFTSTRVLLIHIDLRQKARDVVSQLPYASITSVKSGWNGLCTIRLLNREILNFRGVPSADRKFVVEFLADIVQLTNAPFEHRRGIEHLCPHCYVFVPAHPPACPACGGRFKSARKAGALSLLFPGLGGWYLGHRGVALLEMLGTAMLWFLLVFAPRFSLSDPASGPPDREYWITVGAILLVAHLIDGMMTQHFGRKGHHPVGEVPLHVSLPPFVVRPKPELNAASKLKINRTAPPM